MKYHPDKNKEAGAEEKFKELAKGLYQLAMLLLNLFLTIFIHLQLLFANYHEGVWFVIGFDFWGDSIRNKITWYYSYKISKLFYE